MGHKRFGFRLFLPLLLVLIAAAVLITWRITYRDARKTLEEKYATLMSGMTSENEVSRQIYIADGIIRSKSIAEPDTETATRLAMRAYVQSFGDPYAYYLSPEEYAKTRLDEDAVQTFVGAVFLDGRVSDGLKVANVYDETPAAYAGLQKGDTVVAVNDSDVYTLGLVRARGLLDGTLDGAVKITVQKQSGEKCDMTLERVPRNQSSAVGSPIGDDVGLIRILEFTDATASDFKSAVETLAMRGTQRYVIDLRGTPGGSLAGTLETLDFLLPEGELALVADAVGSVTGNKMSDTDAFLAPVSVITDGFTASTAELFAAVLKEYDRAKTVGSTTYGKGRIQETVSLSDGGAILISSAEYRTPAGVSFEGVGVTPDIPAEPQPDTADAVLDTAVAVVSELPLDNTEI